MLSRSEIFLSSQSQKSKYWKNNCTPWLTIEITKCFKNILSGAAKLYWIKFSCNTFHLRFNKMLNCNLFKHCSLLGKMMPYQQKYKIYTVLCTLQKCYRFDFALRVNYRMIHIKWCNYFVFNAKFLSECNRFSLMITECYLDWNI